MMTTKEIQVKLDTTYVSKYKGQFKYCQSYFYRHGMTEEKLAEKVKAKIPSAVITGTGDHFHNFVGSAKSGSSKDSYLWVTFTV